MAILARTKDGDHFYIRPGQGTKQISKEGERWLCEHGQEMPQAGKTANLDYGTYRFLEDHHYLYIYDIDYQDRITQYFAPSSSLLEESGPPLLLKINTSSHWTLHIKIDEISATDREVLIKEEDVAIGCDPSDLSSMVELRFLHHPHYWPSVKPQSANYRLYYKNWEERAFLLAQSTSGLLDNWQGNVFCACEQSDLAQYWRRIPAKDGISLKDVQDLYWLAQSGEKPEWPGDDPDRIGQPQDGWQLWRLPFNEEALLSGISLIEFENWFRYRGIRLNYPRWRIHVLNPLSSSTEVYRYSVQQGQPLLFECIPPSKPGGNASLTINSSAQPTSDKGRVIRQPLSMSLLPAETNYLRFQVPRDSQEYLLKVSGEAARQSLRILVAPQFPWQMDWLDGFQCCLKVAEKRYDLYAFTREPSQSHEYSLFHVPEHFTLAELAQLTWHWNPAELPCSVRYEYHSLQGEVCHEHLPPATTASVLTESWQNIIWDKVRDSSCVKLTLDAGSFGRIIVKFQLKPEEVKAPQVEDWWTNKEIVTALLWLSQSAQSKNKGKSYPLSPTMQITLKQLCQPGMPTHITAALLRLSSYKTVSGWAYMRLQTLLAEISLDGPVPTKK